MHKQRKWKQIAVYKKAYATPLQLIQILVVKYPNRTKYLESIGEYPNPQVAQSILGAIINL